MTPDQEKLLFDVLVQVRLLAAQLQLHTCQQRVQAALEPTKTSNPKLTDEQLAAVELDIYRTVQNLLESERADLERIVRAELGAAAPKPPDSPSPSLN